MNKRFSTLVAAALVVGGLSVSAQTVPAGEYFTKPEDLKASEHPFVYLSNEKKAGIDLAVTPDGELKAHSQITSVEDSTIAVIDSMAWKVIEVPGAVKTFKFQNRATGHFLSLKAKEYETTVDISDKAISTWALDETNGLKAQVGDSIYYLGVKNDGTEFCLIREGGTHSDQDSYLFPRAIKNTIFLTADDFNKEIKGFKFAAVTDRDAKSDVDGGAKNILTETQWVAKTNDNLKDTQGHKYLLFQKKGSEDETNYLKVDTNFVEGTQSYKLILDSCKVKQATGTAEVRGYVRYDVTEEDAEEPSYLYTIHDSLALFRVTYDYSRDSLNIYPVALPAKKHVNVWDGTDADPSAVDTVSVMFYSEKFGVKAGGDSAMVALRTLEGLTCLVIDSCKNVKANAKDEGSIGVTMARIISTGRSTALGGDARIATNKVYFMKSMNKAAKNGVGGNEDYDKYKVVSLNGTETSQTAKGSAFMPSTQWIVKEGNADGLYTVMNREFADKKISGSFNVVKDADGKAIANTYVCNNDTILLEDAECASVEDLITVKGHKRATTGYGYFEPTTLKNKKFKIASASPYLQDLFMQPQKGSLALSKDEFGFKLEVVGNKEFGAEVAGVDTLYRQSYKLVTEKGEYVTLMNNKMSYGLSDGKSGVSVFFLKSISAGTYALIDTTGMGKDEDWDNAHQVAVNVQSETPAIMAVAVGSKLDLFTVTELDAPSMLFSAPDHFNVYNNNDRLAMGKDNMAVMAQPGNGLKAEDGKFTNDDFTLWFDTVNYKTDIEASYFISKGVQKATEEKAAAERLYLTLACQDSIEKSDDLKAMYKIDNKKRLYFRTAARYGVDSLIVNNFDEEAGVIAPDTVCAGVDQPTFNKSTKTNQLPGIKNFKFQFLAVPGTTDNYYMKPLGDDVYVVSVNGLLAAAASTASESTRMVVTLKAPDYETANEAAPAVSEVKVIATDGGVQIVGAEGKKVVITNILGQTVANAVLTSSDATIAAPAGVVVVAVEGEEAVKAIVK